LKAVTKQLAKARIYVKLEGDIQALEQKVAEAQTIVEDVGDPPRKFVKVAKRVKLVPNNTHRLGQGGIPSHKATFVSTLCCFHVAI
jgi:hypothetical protein